MGNLLSENEASSAWADRTAVSFEKIGVFGSFNSGVIWAELKSPSEGRTIPINPEFIVNEINERGLPLLLNHDPGRPIGRVVAARLFEAKDGRKFIGAVFGFYNGAVKLGFSDFGFDASATPASPKKLPDMGDDYWIQIAVDPREVESAWVDRAILGAPLRVKRRPLSHNAADAVVDLIRLTVPYAVLVWNPFVTAIATEAGKDVYKAFRNWLGGFIERLSERRNPILILQASLKDCDVSFILRGNDLDKLISARGSLQDAAAQAVALVDTLTLGGVQPRALFYEFEEDRNAWVPSYAELHDGRLITDNRALVIAEKLPPGLSLGLGGPEDDEFNY